MEAFNRCTKKIETTRLTLRALDRKDAEIAFAGWTSDQEVAHFMPWNVHTSIQDTKEWLLIEERKVDSAETFNWGIVEKSSGQLIGTIGINIEDECCELGYCLSKNYWNKGYMTEAIQAVLAYIQTELRVKFIYARVAMENASSAHLLEKLAFQDMGECTYSSYDEKRMFKSRNYCLSL